jgi:hypothetical protein
MTTKLIDKLVNTEPSGLRFIFPSLKPRPEFYPRHASKVPNLNLLFSKNKPRSGVHASNKRPSLSGQNKENISWTLAIFRKKG